MADSNLNEIRRLVNEVQDYAEKHRQAYIVPEHMLLILLSDKKCSDMIRRLTTDKDKNKAVADLKKDVEEYLEREVETLSKMKDINPTQAYTTLIHSSISQGSMRSIDPDSLCVFLMLFSDPDQASAHFLSMHGITEDKVQEYINSVRSGAINSPAGGAEKKYLAKYSTELVQMARDGKIDRLIGREKEVERIIQVLSKRKSSNVVICGNAGVGKSAVVEGLALKIANDDVPESLAGKSIYAIDLTGMVAGTKYRGEFEERLENVIKEAAGDEDTILFIDELHTIVGAGSSEGSMDSANILKPYLSRGELRVIGATTYDGYKNKIEKDKALCRRFKKLDLSEPSKDETFQILQGLRQKYEEFHKVKFSDEVLQYIVDLSSRYVIGKYFPDKAIDIMDEIGARYRSGLKRGKQSTKKDVEDVICAVANITKISVETDDKEKMRTLGDRIKQNLFGQDEVVDKLVRQVRMNAAGLSPQNKPQGAFLMLGCTGVGKTELAKTLAAELGIGFTKLDMSEYQEDYSVSRLIGASAGYVGYEQAGALTEPLIQNPHQVILLDEIEKANKSVYDLLLQVMDEGKLTDNHGREASFRNAILLMTSNVGCANADAMSDRVGFVKSKADDTERRAKAVQDAFKKKFSPEFRNRLTDVFYFSSLNDDVLGMIVDKNIRRLNALLADKKVEIEMTGEAKKWFVKKAAEEHAGGRPVERLINSEVAEKLADEVLFGTLCDGGKAVVDVNGDAIAVKYLQEAKAN